LAAAIFEKMGVLQGQFYNSRSTCESKEKAHRLAHEVQNPGNFFPLHESCQDISWRKKMSHPTMKVPGQA
jgi:hypothetical protein